MVEEQELETTEQTEQSEENSIRADIEKAYDAIYSKKEENVEEVKTQEAETQQSQVTEEEKPEEQKPQVVEEQNKTFFGPRTWSKEDRLLLEKVDPSIRGQVANVLAKRDREMNASYTRAMMEVNDKGRQYGSIEEKLAAVRHEWARNGVSDAEAIGQLIDAHKFLQRDPVNAIRTLAQNYGLELSQLSNPEFQGQKNFMDPRVDMLLSQQAEEEQRQVQEHNQSLVLAVQDFAEETDANGKLLRPDFELVQEDMQPIVAFLQQKTPNASPTEILQEAYNRAIRANPETWQRMQQAESAKLANQKKQAVSSAKSRAVSVVGSSGSPLPQRGVSASNSVRDDILAAMSELGI